MTSCAISEPEQMLPLLVGHLAIKPAIGDVGKVLLEPYHLQNEWQVICCVTH
jgi:hypothetical protein